MNQIVNNASAMMCERATHYDIGEFINGQRDCRDGITHKPGMTESYDAGYAAQYEIEQVMGAIGGN